NMAPRPIILPKSAYLNNAGAMLFVISDEIVPETHMRGHERIATLGTLFGVIVMLYLDISLG
ncbi:MAG: hypothetical protein ABEJ73_02235, partial [Haloplanus sp.]